MLFSEPKIPQCRAQPVVDPRRAVSVLFSEPKIPQFSAFRAQMEMRNVSVLFSEPKIPQSTIDFRTDSTLTVSVLFSEPKIPQSKKRAATKCSARSFSALQRAENSSIHPLRRCGQRLNWFQCSSASRKFLNPRHRRGSAAR